MLTTYGNIIKTATRTSVDGIKFLVTSVLNIFGCNNETSNIQVISPYGMSSYPVNYGKVVVQPISGSNKEYVISGFVQGLPNSITHNVVAGEAWLYSNKYILVAQNDGVMAYRGDNTFHATLPIGEAFVAMMVNRITEIEQMIATINANYATLTGKFNSHTHSVSGVQGGSGTVTAGATGDSLSQTNVTVFPTLAKDKSYLNAGKALIDDNGEIYA